jgi:hypothetical protein
MPPAADARHVIAETDVALAQLLKARVIGTAEIGIAFDPPNRPWIQGLKGPAVNLFLFDVKENAQRRDVMYEEVRDGNQVVIARRRPPARVDLHYTVSVWAPTVLVEHRVLAAVLRCFLAQPVLPREVMPAALAQVEQQVLLSVGAGPKRGMFINLGGDLKGAFELSVTIPMPAMADLPAPPPVQEASVGLASIPDGGPAVAAGARESVTTARAASAPPPPAQSGDRDE